MDKKQIVKDIIGDTGEGEVVEIGLIKKALILFAWYLVGRFAGVLVFFIILAIIGYVCGAITYIIQTILLS